MQPFASLSESADRLPVKIPPAPVDPHRFREIRHASILIADHDPQEMELIKVCLQMDGFQTLHFAGSSAEVVPQACECRPDLILLDIHMAEPSGLETLRAIRSHPDLAGIPVVILVAEMTSDTKLQVLECGATDLLPKPIHHAELISRTRNVLAAKVYQSRLFRYSQQLEEAVRQRTVDLEMARLDLVHCLARAAEFRDDDTGHHILRVGRYARVIGDELGLSPQALDVLEQAAQLHDVGKIGIPDSVLLKPGKLTAEEYEVIQKHCGYGKKIIEGKTSQGRFVRDAEDLGDPRSWREKTVDIGQSPFLCVAQRIALTHHERWDGRGYPVGLAGEDIPLEGRITAVADVFDALSSKRPYKPAFPLDKCFRIMEERRGSQFDPAVIDAFFVRREEIVQIQIDFADTD